MLSLNTKILIDRIVGTPIVHVLNLASQVLGKILRRDHAFGESVKTIMVCKLLGLGGIIQSTPLLQALKKHYPQAKIVYVTTNAGKGTCEAFVVQKRFAAYCPVLDVKSGCVLEFRGLFAAQ
jgi:hypothetical protein